jgi:hypothetical protein
LFNVHAAHVDLAVNRYPKELPAAIGELDNAAFGNQANFVERFKAGASHYRPIFSQAHDYCLNRTDVGTDLQHHNGAGLSIFYAYSPMIATMVKGASENVGNWMEIIAGPRVRGHFNHGRFYYASHVSPLSS